MSTSERQLHLEQANRRATSAPSALPLIFHYCPRFELGHEVSNGNNQYAFVLSQESISYRCSKMVFTRPRAATENETCAAGSEIIQPGFCQRQRLALAIIHYRIIFQRAVLITFTNARAPECIF